MKTGFARFSGVQFSKKPLGFERKLKRVRRKNIQIGYFRTECLLQELVLFFFENLIELVSHLTEGENGNSAGGKCSPLLTSGENFWSKISASISFRCKYPKDSVFTTQGFAF